MANAFVTAMIRMLEKYAASTFDIVGNLPEDVAIRVLSNLNVVELLDVETVCYVFLRNAYTHRI